MEELSQEIRQKQGERVQSCRNEKKLTRKELGALASVTDKHIYNIETGKRTLTRNMARVLAAELGVSAEYLLCETDYETPEKKVAEVFGKYDDLKELANEFLQYWLEINCNDDVKSFVRLKKKIGNDETISVYDILDGIHKDCSEYTVDQYLYFRKDSDECYRLSPKDLFYLPFELLDYIEMRLKQITDYNSRDDNRYYKKAIRDL